MNTNTPVILIVTHEREGKTRRKTYHECPSHAKASKLARHMFDGLHCVIKNKKQRNWNSSMKSYCDIMAAHIG